MYEQISAKDNKIIELSEELVALKRQVWDLEEGLKEKDEIISARTAAVGLASASLAAKGWCSNSELCCDVCLVCLVCCDVCLV